MEAGLSSHFSFSDLVFSDPVPGRHDAVDLLDGDEPRAGHGELAENFQKLPLVGALAEDGAGEVFFLGKGKGGKNESG